MTTSNRIETSSTELNNSSKKISEIGRKLEEPNLVPQERLELTSHLDYYKTCYKLAEKNREEATKEMKDLCTNDLDISNSGLSELF
jgi:hypothetical protein